MTPQDRLSEFDEQFTEIVQVRPKIVKQLDPKIKHHLVQTILSVLQEQKAVVEGMIEANKNSIDKIPEVDERARLTNRLNENMVFGYQQALSDYKHSLEETIKEWEKMV